MNSIQKLQHKHVIFLLLLQPCAIFFAVYCIDHTAASLRPGQASPLRFERRATFFEKRRRGALSGYHFKITVVEDPTFMKVRNVDGSVAKKEDWGGFIPFLIEEIAERAGFTYDTRLPSGLGPGDCNQPEGRRGLRNLTSNYKCGQIDTIENRTDMFFSLFYATPSRANVTFTTHPFITGSGLSIITIRKEEEDFWRQSLTVGAPFSTGLWITVALSMFVSAIIFWFLEDGGASDDFQTTESFVHGSFVKNGYISFRTLSQNMLHSFWLTVSNATGLYAHTLLTAQGRVFSIFWQIFILVMLASYTANLAVIFFDDKPFNDKTNFLKIAISNDL